MVVRCLLVCEGSSDIALASHVQRLLVEYGYPQPEFTTATSGRQLVDKIRNGLGNIIRYSLLFVHRDSDRDGPDARHGEISRAIEEATFSEPWIGIVPVRMTEAWLLLDEVAIRDVVGNPNGRAQLNLPSPVEAERMADPKTTLQSVLLTAGDVQGRRRRKLEQRFPRIRNQLLENLPVGGPLEQLPSWVRFRDDTIAALQQLRTNP